MHHEKMDAYFHAASHGDESAYGKLYSEFVELAKIIIKSNVKTYSKYKGIPKDFSEIIDDLFFRSLNDYDQTKGSYSGFCEYILNMRLSQQVKDELKHISLGRAQVDYDDEEINAIELMSDPHDVSIADDIALSDFILKVASPSTHKSKEQRLIDRIMLLRFAGYHNTEIAKILKIPYTTLRRILKELPDEDDISKYKIDLK